MDTNMDMQPQENIQENSDAPAEKEDQEKAPAENDGASAGDDKAAGQSGEPGEPEQPKENQDNAKQDDGAWENLGRDLPENCGLDQELLSDFGKSAREMGLNPDQAKKLIDWQLEAVKKAQSRLREEGLKTLQGEWGSRVETNLNRALGVAAMLDRKLDGEFGKAIMKYGIGDDVNFVRGLYEISRLIGEDSIGAEQPVTGRQNQETALEGLQGLFGKGK